MSIHPNNGGKEQFLQQEINGVKSDMAVVKVNIQHITDDIHEIKEAQREFNKYMLTAKGGKMWALGFVSIAAGLGAIASHIANLFLHR